MVDFLDNYGGLLFFVLFFGILLTALAGCLVAVFVTSSNSTNAINQAKHDLELQGFTVVKGEINSPTVIELTSNYKFFSETSQGQKIYQDNSRFIAVFNSTYGLSYAPEYDTPIWFVWG